ncbi:hypothetical protein BTO30_13220 [Domibacillus antri]|uniref:Uncharacterized protein n=1 Tax=Domibacillus antri TaxID=1714264 RepID=A0A1Q8Q331_9BACI|nr:hypothetical protein [Domibacillus antri]OLN21754.1 hypothetical protein BTO30_13220 [Domibacillus antri]
MITFKTDISDKLKREIRQTVVKQVVETKDVEPFAVINKDEIIVGIRDRNKFIIKRVIHKVI